TSSPASGLFRALRVRHGALVPGAVALPLRPSSAPLVALHGGARAPAAAIRPAPLRGDLSAAGGPIAPPSGRRGALDSGAPPHPLAVPRARLCARRGLPLRLRPHRGRALVTLGP